MSHLVSSSVLTAEPSLSLVEQHLPAGIQPLPTPEQLTHRYAPSPRAQADIREARQQITHRLATGMGAPLAIVGPCSIHCERAALDYAQRLRHLQTRLQGRVQLVMRVYFEKPRTTIGWKGFLYDPDLDGRSDLALGLRRARRLLVEIAEMGVPMASEILDPLLAPYVEDCLSWVAVGARTSESQIHRQMASGLACPVGFKNGTDGSVQVALDAMESASSAHAHLGVGPEGRVSVKHSPGNGAVHLVLRGGSGGPNYSPGAVGQVHEQAAARGLRRPLLIDCSHGNSQKDHRRQAEVARSVIEQLSFDQGSLLGLMLESHLQAGSQAIGPSLAYGVSVTDACIDFAETEQLLTELAQRSRGDG